MTELELRVRTRGQDLTIGQKYHGMIRPTGNFLNAVFNTFKDLSGIYLWMIYLNAKLPSGVISA